MKRREKGERSIDPWAILAGKTLGAIYRVYRACEPALLAVIEEDAFVAQLFPENPVLFREVGYHFLLLPVHPAGNGHRDERPRLPHGRRF